MIKLFLGVLFCGISIAGRAQDSTLVEYNTNLDSMLEVLNKKFQGQPFPGFSDSRPGGTGFTRAALEGKVTYINFWFEHCPPCIAEMEMLNRLYYRLKPYKHFQFISFTFEKPERVKYLVRKFHIPYPVVTVSEEECYRLNLGNGFPTSMATDRRGRIAYFRTGGSTAKVEVERVVWKKIYPALLHLLRKSR